MLPEAVFCCGCIRPGVLHRDPTGKRYDSEILLLVLHTDFEVLSSAVVWSKCRVSALDRNFCADCKADGQTYRTLQFVFDFPHLICCWYSGRVRWWLLRACVVGFLHVLHVEILI